MLLGNKTTNSNKTLKNVMFERLDCWVRKYQLDIEFRNTYHKYNAIPTYSKLLLDDEIQFKK